MAKDVLLDRTMYNLGYHKPEHPETQDAMQKIREAAQQYANVVINTVPEGRELSLALTDLETSTMQAIAGLARNEQQFMDENQPSDESTNQTKDEK